mmetsp:Transcript_84468/g.213053  ORF Transcript_84468/g.213053 Transcript_84468/m.213053 type:complete len:206 (-) Transcript_84468:640-1257(-)
MGHRLLRHAGWHHGALQLDGGWDHRVLDGRGGQGRLCDHEECSPLPGHRWRHDHRAAPLHHIDDLRMVWRHHRLWRGGHLRVLRLLLVFLFAKLWVRWPAPCGLRCGAHDHGMQLPGHTGRGLQYDRRPDDGHLVRHRWRLDHRQPLLWPLGCRGALHHDQHFGGRHEGPLRYRLTRRQHSEEQAALRTHRSNCRPRRCRGPQRT